MRKKIFIFIFFFIFFIWANVLFAEEIELFNSIENKNSDLFIEVAADKMENIVFKGDEIIFYFAVSQECEVILLRLTAGGELLLIFPNKSHPGFKVSSGEKYKIPGFKMDKIIIEGPSGIEKVKAITVREDGFFEKFITPAEKKDFTEVTEVSDFLKNLKDKLTAISEDKWSTAELEISVEETSPEVPETYPTPVINPELENLFTYDYSTEFYMQGSSYYKEGNYDGAIEMFKKVITIKPDLAYGYYSLGLSYQAKGAFFEAISYYKRCLDQEVKEIDCFLRVGEIYDQTGDKKEAYLRYKKALRETEGFENINKINPTDKSKERIYDLEITCKNNPGDKESRTELAVIYETLGDFKSGNYHLKMLLKDAIFLYEPCLMEEDRPEIEKPVEPAEYVYYEPYSVYTYYEPYEEPYIPPAPPPAEESPGFIFVED